MPFKVLKIFVGLFLIFAVVVGLASINYPILLKWLTGSARIIGRPISAKVLTNGQVNSKVKTFHADTYWEGEKADYFLLYFPVVSNKRMRTVVCINRQDKIVAKPSSQAVDAYDIFLGFLFQSDMGKNFSSYQDEMKGYGFNPELEIGANFLKFKVPYQEKDVLECDSIQVEL